MQHNTKLLYGLTGALLGFTLGGATAFLFVSSAVDGDGLGVFFLMVVWGPVGLIAGTVLGVMFALRVLRYVRENQQGKHIKRSNSLLVLGCVLAVPILDAAMVWNGNQYQYPPSNQQLLNNFRFHHAQLDELAQMKLLDKGLMQVRADWTQPLNPRTVGISPERIAVYRFLLLCAGMHQGLGAERMSGVDFTCWAQGGATSSDIDKGYAYLPVPPK